jgi:hypothetical protein
MDASSPLVVIIPQKAGRLYLERVFGVYSTVHVVVSLLLVRVLMREAFKAFADARYPRTSRFLLPKSPVPLDDFIKQTIKEKIDSVRVQVDSLRNTS